VLSKTADPGAWERLLSITGLSPKSFDTHYWKYRLDYDRGTLNGRTFWQAIGRDTGVQMDAARIDALIEQDILLWTALNPVMLDWLVRVRARGLKTAILSNMGEDLLAHMREHFRWLDGFDHLTWSCELRSTKPEAAIYQHTLEKLGVQPQEALFLDDKMENVEGARAVGMHALLFRDPETLEEDLRREGWARELPAIFPTV